MTTKTLIRGGCVLTLGAKTANKAEADILIEDGRIAEIGQGLRARDAEQVDASASIVMPGFVDTHRHVWRSLFRNLGTSTGEGMDSKPLPGPEEVYAATFIGLLGAIEAGITTVVDWSDITPETSNIDASLQAHADSGLRTVYVHAPESPHEEARAGLRRLAAGRAKEADPQTTLAYGAASPTHSDLDRVGRDWGLAREVGMRIHTHVGLDHDQRGVVSELGRRDLLGDDVTLIHCSAVDKSDLDAISDHGVRVSLTPSREMADGIGIPPVQDLMERGIRPGLGVDNESMGPGDIFAQMRATNSIQHATHFDQKLAGKGGLASLLGTRDVIRFATIDGARAVGLGEATGSIEVGKRADIIVLRTDRPNIHPINDPIGAVVWGMDTSNLHWVFSNGKALMREGVMTVDVASAREKAQAAHERVAGGVGIGGSG